jgi:hypothetical protein
MKEFFSKNGDFAIRYFKVVGIKVSEGYTFEGQFKKDFALRDQITIKPDKPDKPYKPFNLVIWNL